MKVTAQQVQLQPDGLNSGITVAVFTGTGLGELLFTVKLSLQQIYPESYAPASSAIVALFTVTGLG